MNRPMTRKRQTEFRGVIARDPEVPMAWTIREFLEALDALQEEVEQVSSDRYDSQQKVRKVVEAMRAGGKPTLGSTGEGVSKWADLLDAAFAKEGEEGDAAQGGPEGTAQTISSPIG